MGNYEILFEASYDRVIGQGVGINPKGEAFFKRFYDNFFSRSDAVKEKFKHTDMKLQPGMLQKSIYHLVSFYISKEENEYLRKFALSHNKNNHNIKVEFYDIWLDTLIQTVRELDPEYDRNIELAWRIALTPGILYMQSHYDIGD